MNTKLFLLKLKKVSLDTYIPHTLINIFQGQFGNNMKACTYYKEASLHPALPEHQVVSIQAKTKNTLGRL